VCSEVSGRSLCRRIAVNVTQKSNVGNRLGGYLYVYWYTPYEAILDGLCNLLAQMITVQTNPSSAPVHVWSMNSSSNIVLPYM
jgi:hypothetical protein